MNIIPFEPAHVGMMRIQPGQCPDVDPSTMAADFGTAWTAMVEGRPIGCAGLLQMWPGRAYAWALLAEDAGPHMLALTRAIRFRLAESGFRRIEMAVDAEFLPGVRWAVMLGFELEARARKYMPNGRDAWIFVRV